ncbi:MAG: hypothetical protein ACLFQK_11665 [Fibrobacterota bacterium]
MPFKSAVDKQKDISFFKAYGRVATSDILKEINTSITKKRNAGISKKLIDLTGADLHIKLQESQTIVAMLKRLSATLRTEKLALLVGKLPKDLDMTALVKLINKPGSRIRIFFKREEAVSFLMRNTSAMSSAD